MKLRIYITGQAKTNPGLAACAYIICDVAGNELSRGANFLDYRSNHFAAREALFFVMPALKALAATIHIEHVTILTDSKPVVNQVNGTTKYVVRKYVYPTKKLKKIINKLPFAVELAHLPREQNLEVINLANKTIKANEVLYN